jgi:hypothetical protein
MVGVEPSFYRSTAPGPGGREEQYVICFKMSK